MKKIKARLLTACFLLCILTAEAVGPIHIACVGDSITFGARIKEREQNSYPAQLGQLLGDQWNVRNFGVSGATLLKKGDKPYWTLPAFKKSHDFSPQVVIIKLGTNDSKPRNWKYQSEYVTDYIKLIKSYQQLDSHPVVYICYPVPIFRDNFKIVQDTVQNEIRPLIDEVARKTGVKIIDLDSVLIGKGDLFPDGVHPNAAGATIMAETIAKALAQN